MLKCFESVEIQAEGGRELQLSFGLLPHTLSTIIYSKGGASSPLLLFLSWMNWVLWYRGVRPPFIWV
jgi:hypothetical protein